LELFTLTGCLPHPKILETYILDTGFYCCVDWARCHLTQLTRSLVSIIAGKILIPVVFYPLTLGYRVQCSVEWVSKIRILYYCYQTASQLKLLLCIWDPNCLNKLFIRGWHGIDVTCRALYYSWHDIWSPLPQHKVYVCVNTITIDLWQCHNTTLYIDMCIYVSIYRFNVLIGLKFIITKKTAHLNSVIK